MMIILANNPIIRCNSCGAEHKINRDMLDCEAHCIGKGGMGEQYEHDINLLNKAGS